MQKKYHRIIKPKATLRLLLLIFIFISQETFIVNAQTEESVSVKGIVVNEYGEPLNNVLLRTLNGDFEYQTGIDGEFNFQIPTENKNIIFSLAGYTNATIAAVDSQNLTIQLKKDIFNKEEIVSLGYTSQSRMSIPGAVSIVSGDQLQKQPSAFLDRNLMGNLSGLISIEQNGDLSSNKILNRVRGFNSLNGQDPCIIIDGIPSSGSMYSSIPAEDILNVVLLKDAGTLALYGLQGATGALVITTRRGQIGPLKLKVSVDQAFQQMTRSPYRISSWDYAAYKNQAAYNDNPSLGRFSQYSETAIQKFIAQDNPLYPNNDYFSMFWKDWSLMQRANVNVTGGGKFARYYSSISLIHQDIPFKTDPKQTKYDCNPAYYRADFRSNLDMTFNKRLSGFLRISGNIEKQDCPGQIMLDNNLSESNPNTNNSLIYNTLFNFSPATYGPLGPDSLSAKDGGLQVLTNNKQANSSYGIINRSGYASFFNTNILSQVGLVHSMDYLVKGLSLSGTFGYTSNSTVGQIASQGYELWQRTGNSDELNLTKYGGLNTPLAISSDAVGAYNLNYFVKLAYQKTIGKGSLDALAYFYYDQNMRGTWNVPATMLPYLHQSNGVSANYGYDSKYFAKVDLGYTGSDLFAPANRYSLTPSVSVAWIASSESFLKGIKWLNYLKFRSSIGYTANDRLAIDKRLLYMDELTPTGVENMVGNPNIVAEKSLMGNLGADLGLFDVVSISLDFFSNKMNNMLIEDRSLPQWAGTYIYDSPFISSTTGSNAPISNIGVMKNTGFDLDIEYSKPFNKNLSVNCGLKISHNRNLVIKYNDIERPTTEGEYAYPYQITGYSLGQNFGYLVDYSNGNGFINNSTELIKYREMYERGGIGTPRLGDFIYKDLNNDGMISEKDYAPIKGVNFPETYYSFFTGLIFKSVEFSVMFQGIGDRYQNINGNLGINETLNDGVYSDAHANAWTEERFTSGEKISFPALGIKNSTSHLSNDFFIVNTSFIRLKNVFIAYKIPATVSKSIKAQEIKLVVSAQNLFTWTRMDMSRYVDPEVGTIGTIQPFRVFSIGLKLIF